MNKHLLNILVCPLCKGKLINKNKELICKVDRLAFPIQDNIPVMLEVEARQLEATEEVAS